MRTEIAAIDLKNAFAGQIIGMGHEITIPDLNNDGAYGLDSFRAAGYRWLAAAPLMTYRAYGLLGAASKNKRLLDKDTTGLLMVIGGLIANALSKALLTRETPHHNTTPCNNTAPYRSALPDVVMLNPEKTPAPADTQTEIAPATLSTEITAESAQAAPPDDTPAAPAEKPRAVSVLEETPPENPPVKRDPAFQAHARKMERFRQAHK